MAVILIVKLIFGGICAAIASSKGRSGVAWFFIGFLLDLIGLIIVLVMSNLAEERRRFEQISADRRRLKEQLRQEQLKGESFRRYASERIDTHDRVLGVNTKRAASLGTGAPPPVPALPRADLSETDVESDWYYERGGQQQGPVPKSKLETLLRSGELGPTTLVWTESMEEWTPANKVPDLERRGR